MVVVDVKRDLPRLLSADAAPATLAREQRVVVGTRDPESPPQVRIAVFCAVLRAVRLMRCRFCFSADLMFATTWISLCFPGPGGIARGPG